MGLVPEAQWLVFTNEVIGVATDPFQLESRVKVVTGLTWKSTYRSSKALLDSMNSFGPDVVILNGTLAILRVLPSILFLRVANRKLRFTCVFHNGPIYPTHLKNLINRALVSMCGIFMHQNFFVSTAVQRYWLCNGAVHPRPFKATPRVLLPTFDQRHLPTIGFLGRLSVEKDPELFLRVMDEVRKTVPCRICLAGLGSLKSQLEKRYDFAEFNGWVDPRAWLKQVDLLVTTSRTEGWPFALGEALESGTPVVGCNVGGVGEILKPVAGKFLLSSRNPSDIAAVILKFLLHYNSAYNDYFSAFANSKESKSPRDWATDLLNR